MSNTKPSQRVIFNVDNVAIDKQPTVKCRVVGDSAFNTFCLKNNLDFSKIKKAQEEPLSKEATYNIPNYNGCNFDFIRDKWWLLDLIFATNKDKEIFNKNMADINNDSYFIGDKTKSIWYPQRPEVKTNKQYWRSDLPQEQQQPKYPIYIISKGRYEKRPTQKALEAMNVNYKIVVEQAEVAKYIEHGVPKEKILIFTEKAKEEITLNCEDWQDGGGIPVRNFVWQHSKNNGDKRHWILDDNIDGFHRTHLNARVPIQSGVAFRIMEDYADQFKNLFLCGLNYSSMMPEISRRRPIATNNTRIYSCILIHNKLNEEITKRQKEPANWSNKWRGRYNEDTDLSLRALKCGLPTVLFNHILCNKMTTMSCKGGNTTSIYAGDGLKKKLEQLLFFHKDVAKQSSKFKKDCHHHVDYSGFNANELLFKRPINNDYKLVLAEHEDKQVRKINKKKVLTMTKETTPEPDAMAQPKEPEQPKQIINNVDKCLNHIIEQNLTEEEKKALIIKILQM